MPVSPLIVPYTGFIAAALETVYGSRWLYFLDASILHVEYPRATEYLCSCSTTSVGWLEVQHCCNAEGVASKSMMRISCVRKETFSVFCAVASKKRSFANEINRIARLTLRLCKMKQNVLLRGIEDL